MRTGKITDRRASRAARQLLYHRERLRWMAGRMEDNAAAIRNYLTAEGKDAAVLPGGYAVGITDAGEVAVSGPRAAEGYEQLEIPEVLGWSMTEERRAPLFELGRVVATPGAVEVLSEGVMDWRLHAAVYLARHLCGDWGEVPSEDARENRFSVEHGFRVLSSYPVGEDGAKVWIITEADRSSTCILLPEEY